MKDSMTLHKYFIENNYYGLLLFLVILFIGCSVELFYFGLYEQNKVSVIALVILGLAIITTVVGGIWSYRNFRRTL